MSGQSEKDAHFKALLAGNPNCGKTTLFNRLTGGRQYVGNRPGVTVEKKEGNVKKACVYGCTLTVADLPGIYSMSPYSDEERVARNCILHDDADVIINIVDAVNIERNLYLTLQLAETGRPLVIALNMMDEVRARGDKIDTRALSAFLNAPVISVSAKTGEGTEELLKAAVSAAAGNKSGAPDIYDARTERTVRAIARLIGRYADKSGIPAGWAAVKLLEGDETLAAEMNIPDDVYSETEKLARRYAESGASGAVGDRETIIADIRYKYIEKAVRSSVYKSGRRKADLTGIIDRVVTDKIFAIPLFLLIMLAVFTLTFSTVGAFFQKCTAGLTDHFVKPSVCSALDAAGSPVWIKDLIADGVIDGVGGVLSFLPQIAILFMLLSLLEDSGYMARVAFIMDRALRRFGLSGKAFIPMLMGFGCSVPAVMATRTMENINERRMTIMLIPFMSCSAKLPVYGFVTQLFFKKHRGLIVLSLYVLGILMGILSGILFRHTLFKGGKSTFVLELPPYRMPELSVTLRHVRYRVEHFIRKAATLIFGLSVLLWVMRSFDISMHYTEYESRSMLSALGRLIAPIFKPAGFGTWQAAVSLLTGMVTKEAVVSSVCLFGGVPGGVIFDGPAGAYAFLVFTLLYVPCIAAVSAMHRELGGLKWTLGSICYQFLTAYAASVLAYTVLTYVPMPF